SYLVLLIYDVTSSNPYSAATHFGGVTDEVILEDEIPKLITEVQHVDKRVPTIYDYARMKATVNDVLSNKFKNAEEYAYHLEQITNFMENQIVWESRQEDIRRPIPRPLILFRP
ncbi:hypothetical protein Tco_0504066, partial [Tanacetum coccineum]